MELKQYTKYTEKLSWLTEGTRPDLSYTALMMSKKNAKIMIVDLDNVSRVLKKVELKESGVSYECIGKKEDLKIIGIGTALFKTDEKAIGGTVL